LKEARSPPGEEGGPEKKGSVREGQNLEKSKKDEDRKKPEGGKNVGLKGNNCEKISGR